MSDGVPSAQPGVWWGAVVVEDPTWGPFSCRWVHGPLGVRAQRLSAQITWEHVTAAVETQPVLTCWEGWALL